MVLVQMLLPLYRPDGTQIPRAVFVDVRNELVARFGGVTAYTRAPAKGLWQEPDGETVKDDVVIHEVMCEELDRLWWSSYRRQLEARFEQQELIIRATEMTAL